MRARRILPAFLAAASLSVALGTPAAQGAAGAPPAKPKRSLMLEANKNKVKKGKKVRLSGHLGASGDAQACESGQGVELQRKAAEAHRLHHLRPGSDRRPGRLLVQEEGQEDVRVPCSGARDREL